MTCPQTYIQNKKNNDAELNNGKCSLQVNDIMAPNNNLINLELAFGNDYNFNIN